MSVNSLIFTGLMEVGFGYSRAIGAYKIAHEIRQAGYTCQVVDFFTDFSEEEMDKILKNFIGEDTLIVGFSATFFMYIDEILDEFQQRLTDGKKIQSPGNRLHTDSYPYHRSRIKKWFGKIREINPDVKIILGGAKAGLCSGFCDAFAIGYCDEAIVNYMKHLEGKNPFFQYEKINEHQILFYGDKNSRNFDFSKSKFRWHETDYISNGEVLPIEIARGCIFKCKFCAYPLNGKNKLDFIKDSDILRDELLKNYYEYGVTRYMYVDDTHNDSIEKLQTLHKIVTKLPFQLEYTAFLRHDLIYAHKETAEMLLESGLRSAIFGIETMNHESGKIIGKGLHPEKIKELLYWLKNDIWKKNVALASGFIVGLPADTPETIYDWSRWLINPDCPLDSIVFEPLYIWSTSGSTRIWKSDFETSAEKYGYVLGGKNHWRNQHFTFPEATKLAKQLMKEVYDTDRQGVAGFPLIISANSGFIPKDLIGARRSVLQPQLKDMGIKFVQRYKDALLGQIDNSLMN